MNRRGGVVSYLKAAVKARHWYRSADRVADKQHMAVLHNTNVPTGIIVHDKVINRIFLTLRERSIHDR